MMVALMKPDNRILDTIIQGDCLEVLRTLDTCSVDACVVDPPYGLGEVKDVAGLLQAWIRDEDDSRFIGKLNTSLYRCIGFTMAWFTKGYKVAESISLLVSLNAKEPERLNMMYMLTFASAMLTGIAVTLKGFTTLGLPIWASIITRAAKPLRMIFSYTMLIATFTGTIFASTLFCTRLACINGEIFIASQASDSYGFCFSWARSYRYILTVWGTIFSPSILCTRSMTKESFTALLAGVLRFAYDATFTLLWSGDVIPEGKLIGYNITHVRTSNVLASRSGVLPASPGHNNIYPHYTMKPPQKSIQEVLTW